MHKRDNAIELFKIGEMSYQEWVDHDIEMWKEKGVTREMIIKAFENNISLMPGAIETLSELKKKGFKLALISGSIDLVLDHLIPNYDTLFDYVFINQIEFDDNGKLLRGIGTPFDLENKAEGMRAIAQRENLDLDECIFVGDNDNDVHIAETAGMSIAFNCKSEKLARIADFVVTEKDLRGILNHIGEALSLDFAKQKIKTH